MAQEKKINVDNFLRKRMESNKNFLGKSVTQYDNKGKKIATYISINEASRRTGVESVSIGRVVNKKAKTAGGYLWKKAPKARQAG